MGAIASVSSWDTWLESGVWGHMPSPAILVCVAVSVCVFDPVCRLPAGVIFVEDTIKPLHREFGWLLQSSLCIIELVFSHVVPLPYLQKSH